MAKVLRRDQRGDSEVKHLPSHPAQNDPANELGKERALPGGSLGLGARRRCRDKVSALPWRP